MKPSLRGPVCTLAAALLLCAACTNGDTEQKPTPTTAPSSSPAEPTPPSAITQSPTPTASAPEDLAEAEQEIRESWAQFFSPETSVEDRADVAENGHQYQLMIQALATDPRARLLRVHIDGIRFTSDLNATTRYTLFIEGRKVGPSGPGESVRQGDTWKVSFKTVCSLAQYGNDVPQAATC